MANYTAPISKNQTLTLNYTGSVDVITITKTGLYKLEVYGASGFDGAGKGGHSVGYVYIKRGTILYACIGGHGIRDTGGYVSGGYNGGGPGSAYRFNNGAATAGHGTSGGGASHVASIPGTLEQIGESRKNTIYLVAGGAGSCDKNYSNYGYGGGLIGGMGYDTDDLSGATQTSGGASTHIYGTQSTFGCASKAISPYDNMYTWGGGGGLYGGGSTSFSQGGGFSGRCGGGGSGYIGGVPTITYKGKSYSPSTVGGVRSGHGIGYITLIESGTPTLFYGDKEIDALYYGDRDIDTLFYRDREIN